MWIQREPVEFDDMAEYVPDIGHFIKCISNALFKLSGQNSELRGVSLLEATRIKAISSDITGIIKDYGKEVTTIEDEFKDDDLVRNQTLNASRNVAMKRLIPLFHIIAMITQTVQRRIVMSLNRGDTISLFTGV
jgi:hypothetical protein